MDQVTAMRAADIPLEGEPSIASLFYQDTERCLALVMWNDIDLYHAFRDFTSDPVSFPGDQVRAFIQELVSSSSSKFKFPF